MKFCGRPIWLQMVKDWPDLIGRTSTDLSPDNRQGIAVAGFLRAIDLKSEQSLSAYLLETDYPQLREQSHMKKKIGYLLIRNSYC